MHNAHAVLTVQNGLAKHHEVESVIDAHFLENGEHLQKVVGVKMAPRRLAQRDSVASKLECARRGSQC